MDCLAAALGWNRDEEKHNKDMGFDQPTPNPSCTYQTNPPVCADGVFIAHSNSSPVLIPLSLSQSA